MDPATFASAFILTGPTGAGKTDLALEIAERYGAEIVAMDSMTLYRGMDIGTAKPTPEEQRRVPHHLLDVLDPWESSSVAWWLERAAECCRDIESRGKRALLVGGTALYLKAMLSGLFDGPPRDEELRGQLMEEAEREGGAVLHARLAAVDPVTASRLHPNDIRRVVRALEVWHLTGRPMSDWQTQWRSAPVTLSAVWIDLPREELYQRINARVGRMIATGLVDEVRALRALSQPLSREAAQALGYKEMIDHLEGRATLTETVERIKTSSRQFAKRQLTWFRHLPGLRALSPPLTSDVFGSRIDT